MKITIAQHMNNIMVAIDNSTMTGKNHKVVLKSFNAIYELLTKPEPKEGEEKFDKTDLK